MAVHVAAHGADEVDHLYAETADLRLTGFVLFLISDVVLFSSFIFAYLYLRHSVPQWPWPPGTAPLDTAFAAVNSVVLFGSGATMHFALENWKHGNRSKWFGWLIATIILGSMFLGGQAYEYSHIQATWGGSIFGASFFTLTGMHGFHVFCGVIYLIILGLQTSQNVYTRQKYFGLVAGTLYWHFVDVIWVALFFLFYLL